MRRIVVTFALAFRFFPSTGSNSAIRTVFRPVGFWRIVTAKEYTFPPVCPVEQGGAQASVQGQDGGAEPFADQRVGNTLWADTFLATVQKQTIPTIIVAAAMYQSAGGAVLLIVHVDNHGTFSPAGNLM